jgi:hypothetical protein
MDGKLTYGPKGRLISAIAGFAGILSAAVSASQQASLVSIFPSEYNKYFAGAAIISIFITLFSERIQGGASKPEVREAARASDVKNAREDLNQ